MGHVVSAVSKSLVESNLLLVSPEGSWSPLSQIPLVVELGCDSGDVGLALSIFFELVNRVLDTAKHSDCQVDQNIQE